MLLIDKIKDQTKEKEV